MVSAFIDSSTLFKKYSLESGTDDLLQWLDKISEVYLSPTTNIELIATIHRIYEEKKISLKELNYMKDQMSKDRVEFQYVQWTDKFDILGCMVAEKFGLKTSDCIQLAAAITSEAEFFITSDKRLFNAAAVELKNAVFI